MVHQHNLDNEITVYFVLGEESGDALAADLVPCLNELLSNKVGHNVKYAGLAGPRLKALGVGSLFDIEDIAVMGITAVLARLPKIIRRVHQTVDDIVAKNPMSLF